MHDFSSMLYENDPVRALMDSLPCGVMILDHQAQVVTINKALEKIFGPNAKLAGKGAFTAAVKDKKGRFKLAQANGNK